MAAGWWLWSFREVVGRGDEPPFASAGGSAALLILFSTLMTVGYAVFVGSPHFGFHALGPAAVAAVVAVSLVVLVDLSYPFSGDVAIAPDDFKAGALGQFFPPP